MADWWETTRNKYESGTTPASSSSSSGLTSMGSFSWPTDIADIKSRSTLDSELVTGASGVFQDTQKLQDPNLHMMGLGLASPAADWSQNLLREVKAEYTNFQQEQWREKLFGDTSGDSSVHEFKQMNRGFSLDQSQFVPQSSSSDTTSTASFPVVSSAVPYGSPATMPTQGLLGYENQSQQSSFDSKSSVNYPYQLANYTMNSSEILPHWSRSVPQFMRTSSPKQQLQLGQFPFSNNTQFWNPTTLTMNDARPNFFPPLPSHFPTLTSEEKPKNISDVGAVIKKSGSETAASKRPRNETSSALPAFKVRKEKMGDRITALQQLVSPFGKTDTASVLSEAIECIKCLHEQVTVLSNPYMKSAPSLQHQQNSDKPKDLDGPRQDLRSRGLCLVPVSNTFPVTHETTVDYWTPSFGGTFR